MAEVVAALKKEAAEVEILQVEGVVDPASELTKGVAKGLPTTGGPPGAKSRISRRHPPLRSRGPPLHGRKIVLELR